MEGDILKWALFDTGGNGIKFHEPAGHQQGLLFSYLEDDFYRDSSGNILTSCPWMGFLEAIYLADERCSNMNSNEFESEE
jgi:hypothetical protein